MNTSKIHDYKQSTLNNSTTLDSVRMRKQAAAKNELKQSMNLGTQVRLNKQRSDPKIQNDTDNHMIGEIGGNSMVTFKLLATIKQSVINKKSIQENICSTDEHIVI